MNQSGRNTLLVTVVLLPIALSVIAVSLGLLKPLFGILAAAGLAVQGVVGHVFGRVLWSWVRGTRRGFLFWLVWSVCIGVGCGIELAAIWGIAGGVLFGIFLSAILISIGCLEPKQAQTVA